MASRSLSDLVPEVRAKVEDWLLQCARRGVEVLVYCTHRSAAEQDGLYALGRTVPGRIVTKARAWQSAHQYYRAVDAVPLRAGKPLWRYDPDAPEWIVFAEEAEAAGLEWSGRWKRFREHVHVQDLGGRTIAQLAADKDKALSGIV